MLFKGKLSIQLLLFGVLFCLTTTVKAQSTMDLRINEVLVMNQANYIDDFGQHSPWIEFFNSAYNTVDMGGLYLTNDLEKPTMYQIAKGDPTTKIAPQNYLVFWGDDHSTRGIRHLNFDLSSSKLVALFDANGRTLIDVVKLDQTHRTDTTYGRITDGGSEWGFLDKSTPGANNNTKTVITSAEKFGMVDPSGLGMAVIAMSVVFSALALLYVFFKNVAKLYTIDYRRLSARKQVVASEKPADGSGEHTGEVNAAIAMALHLYRNQLHDHENTVLTIRKVSRTYSPWSSKIYGVLNNSR
ncbi:MAG TPA: phage tail protein [Bacteroidales bacterium]|nr:MAG: hypothetical protein A2X11_01505 [Bacteroidetes bacterium GWE2_42_24]OFY27365.1 MAG: hypothetical protein A2X09_00710 [Bacteroidetes bacterium GWF2_43_11]HAQ65007.1 phage tail protein [Bacteroidales bacterium]HBZ65879.1 phage tail protein [Bacteroidales bacterium]